MIEVGEYVRTKSGLIGKVNEIELAGSGVRYAGEFLTDTIIQFNDGKVYERRVKDKDIVNYSKNIIDLIEVGDFVNGYKILEIANIKNSEQRIFTICKSDFKSICKIWEEQDIQTILTKEQYERNCYTVERVKNEN